MLSAVCVDQDIAPRDPSNPYGEVISAAIIVQGLTLPTFHFKQVLPWTTSFYVREDFGNVEWDHLEHTEVI